MHRLEKIRMPLIDIDYDNRASDYINNLPKILMYVIRKAGYR